MPHPRPGTVVIAGHGGYGQMSTGHKATRGRLERTTVTRTTGRSGARSIASRSASIAANIRQGGRGVVPATSALLALREQCGPDPVNVPDETVNQKD
jgi:hypothetical protein